MDEDDTFRILKRCTLLELENHICTLGIPGYEDYEKADEFCRRYGWTYAEYDKALYAE